MRYIFYILFFSAAAFAQQDSIQVTVRNIEGRPNATFAQTLSGQMPNLNIVLGNPNDFYNTYKLTEADKDSVYKAAFNGPIVQEAIKNNFSKSRLFEKGYELELISVLKSDSISNGDKKKLLIGRILADWQYDELHGRPTTEFVDGYNITLYNTTIPYQNRNEASEKFILQHKTIIFSRILYLIDWKPYEPKDIKSLQLILEKLKKANIFYLELLTGSSATANFGSRGVNGVVIISTVN